MAVRGRDAAVILSASDYSKFVPANCPQSALELFDSLPDTGTDDFDLSAEPVFSNHRDILVFE